MACMFASAIRAVVGTIVLICSLGQVTGTADKVSDTPKAAVAKILKA